MLATLKMKTTLKFLLFILATIAMSCGAVKPNSAETKNEDTITIPSDIKILNNGVLINHHSYGEGKYTLLFVHGWCINQSYWSSQVEALRSDYRIVTIDLPGFGESGKNRGNWSIEEYGTDINAVIEQLKLSNVILVGHSMGGDVILEAALQNKHEQVVALIGIDNFKDVGTEYNAEIKAEIDGFVGMLKDNYSEVVSAYAKGALFHPSTNASVKSRIINDFISSDSSIAVMTLENLFEYALVEAEQLSKLNQKLYLINSDASPTDTVGLNKAGIVYEIVDIAATGHYPMIEKPAVFNKLLKQTIQKIEASHSKK